MSGQLSISMVEQDFASSRMAALLEAIGPENTFKQVGEVMREFVSDHFATLENQRGGGKSHFYEKASEDAHLQMGEGGSIDIAVTAPIGIRQRILGGDILPKNGKALAIPAADEAFGKSPRDFNNLVMIWLKGETRGMLVDKQKKGIKGKIMYWLVGKVSQDPDPSVAPDAEQGQQTLDTAVISMLNAVGD